MGTGDRKTLWWTVTALLVLPRQGSHKSLTWRQGRVCVAPSYPEWSGTHGFGLWKADSWAYPSPTSGEPIFTKCPGTCVHMVLEKCVAVDREPSVTAGRASPVPLGSGGRSTGAGAPLHTRVGNCLCSLILDKRTMWTLGAPKLTFLHCSTHIVQAETQTSPRILTSLDHQRCLVTKPWGLNFLGRKKVCPLPGHGQSLRPLSWVTLTATKYPLSSRPAFSKPFFT